MIGKDGGKVIGASLAKNMVLRALNIRKPLARRNEVGNNEIGDEGCRVMCQALSKNQSLHALWLDNNDIGYEGFRHISDMLQHNNTLAELYVGIYKVIS